MHFLNNGKHALVFPPRCGTRWIAGLLHDNKLLNTRGPHHNFYWEEKPNVKTFMFVRNPFTRERSLHRWLAETRKIDIDEFTFEDYVDSTFFDVEPSWYNRYGDLNNHVTHIHLEEVDKFLTEEIGIEVPEYDFVYRMADDNRPDNEIFNNPHITNKIFEKYKEDLKHLDFDLTLYT